MISPTIYDLSVMISLLVGSLEFSDDPSKTATPNWFYTRNLTKFIQETIKTRQGNGKEHKTFLLAWMSEYKACTILTKVIREYSCQEYYCHIANIMKRDIGTLTSSILSMMYRSLFDIIKIWNHSSIRIMWKALCRTFKCGSTNTYPSLA